MSAIEAAGADVQVSALWSCYRSAQRDDDMYQRQRARQEMYLIACSHRDSNIRVIARCMLRSLIAQATSGVGNPVEAPCA